jgi:endoglucanase
MPVALPAVQPVPRRAAAIPCRPDDRAEWELFKRRFVSAEGRVVDTGNGFVSHSEGQGWGMLFAVAFDDPDCFDSLLAWTSANLTRPDDALHAWRYLPQAARKVPDLNNATDADLFIAAALWRAARRWGRPDHAMAARAIARDVLRLLTREAGARLVLLPGAQGFVHGDQLTVNPSYYVFPVLDDMAALHPSPLWARLHADGLQLLDDGRFGQWRLPPDWLRVDRATGALAPHPNWPARFSYDAIRVPLYLGWGGLEASAACLSFAAYWSTRQPAPPAWVDLQTNASANYPAPPGMIAVARMAINTAQSQGRLPGAGGFPALRTAPDYYSAALILLSRLAWLERSMV